MAKESSTRDKSKNESAKGEKESDIYISYNSLSQSGEVKSVSQAMHKYIKEGFAKIAPKKMDNK